MAYVLGFFAADGYITVNKRGGQFWCIEISEKKLLEAIRQAIGSNHSISLRQRREKFTSYRLQIGSIQMCDDLRKFGFGERKTKNLSIPHVPKDFFNYFIRGYFDGDGNVWVGYVHKERTKTTLAIQTVLTSCSIKFLSALHERLRTDVGISGALRKSPKGEFYRLVISVRGTLKLYDFMYNHGVLNQRLSLPRKKRVFERFIKMRS